VNFTPANASPHWAINYIGKPWVACGRGPASFDCWGLVWHVYKHVRGVDLPQYPVHPANLLAVAREFREAKGWTALQAPEDLCLVAMSQHGRYLHHVGLWLDVDGGKVLHAWDGQAVIAQSLSSLKAYGWARIDFYKHGHFN
jgi:cell wall-associated NlpC family hydrolase